LEAGSAGLGVRRRVAAAGDSIEAGLIERVVANRR
jgi:hypothetical protein